MIKYPPNQSNSTKQDAETSGSAKAEAFVHQPQTDGDARTDAFLAAQGAEFQDRIDATPKEFFVRQWAGELARQGEKRKEYEASVKRLLDQPEYRELKEKLDRKYRRDQERESVKESPVFRQAAPRTGPRMTP